MTEAKSETKTTTPAKTSAKKPEEGVTLPPAGLNVDVEGHVNDPADIPKSGQTAALKQAEEDKLAEAKAVEEKFITKWEEAEKAEAEAVKAEKEREDLPTAEQVSQEQQRHDQEEAAKAMGLETEETKSKSKA